MQKALFRIQALCSNGFQLGTKCSLKSQEPPGNIVAFISYMNEFGVGNRGVSE